MTDSKPIPKVRVTSNAPFTFEPTDEMEARQAAVGELMAQVIHVIETLMAIRGINRRTLAKKLGRSESTISRQLDGTANLTIESIAQIFSALEDRPYLGSAGYDCFVNAGRIADLRPRYIASNAPAWLTSAGVTCDDAGKWRSVTMEPATASSASVIYSQPTIAATKKHTYA
ncbi:MAG: helix-turn-helix domain-containing protein [Pseudomonadota bacterium]